MSNFKIHKPVKFAVVFFNLHFSAGAEIVNGLTGSLGVDGLDGVIRSCKKVANAARFGVIEVVRKLHILDAWMHCDGDDIGVFQQLSQLLREQHQSQMRLVVGLFPIKRPFCEIDVVKIDLATLVANVCHVNDSTRLGLNQFLQKQHC